MKFIQVKKTHPYDHLVAKKHGGSSIWSIIREFVNTININDTFTRKELLFYIYEENSVDAHRHTPDCYRNDLCHCCFIEKTDKRGVYKKLRHIPENMTTSQVRTIGYDKTWTEWFVPLETKLEKKGLV